MRALLASLTGLGPLTVDMYLASMPDIGRALMAPTAQVQLTISVYLIGFALGQMFYGPLSDRHGRRPVMMAALGVYCIATLACLSAPSIEMLIAARFCQAIGGAGAIVLARAVVRDLYDGTNIGRELSLMASIMALAPIVAPLAGGVSSDIWRVDLARGPVCIKRALPRLKVAAVWEAPVERNRYEFECSIGPFTPSPRQ